MPQFKKKVYDPGLFRFTVGFWKEVSTKNRSGGQSVALQSFLQTLAVREDIREGNQLAIAAGASYLNEDCYFIIRNRQGFYPTKSMKVLCEGSYYTIAAVIEINIPVTYIKLLCKKEK